MSCWDRSVRDASSRRRSLLPLAAALIVGVAGCAKSPHVGEPVSHEPGPILRVAIATDATEVTVACDRSWHVAFNGKRVRPNDLDGGSAWVFRHEGGANVRVVDDAGMDRGVFAETFLLYPKDAGATMRYRGRAYRGYFVLTASGSGLTLVNRIRLEDYVRGVVGNEIGHGDESTMAALEAQAVAARTYAYMKVATHQADAFDVSASAMDQVYTGASGESPVVAEACSKTNGQLLTWNGAPVEALYSATCGGRTADPTEVWEGTGQPHLTSRRDRVAGEDLCAHSKYYRWQTRWTGEGFMSTFKRYYPRYYSWDGTPFGTLRDVRVTARGPSDRVTEVTIETDTGRYVVTGDRIRWVFRRSEAGEPALWSTAFDIEVDRSGGVATSVACVGRGHGHGVGMCQAGALAMSTNGYGYREILRHYYPGTSLTNAY